MDFLGLRNLTVLDDAVANIKLNRGFELVLEDLALDDPATYALLGRGDTLGVFQLDGGPMRSLLRADAAGQLRRHLRRAGALPARPDGGRQPHQLRAAARTGRQEVTPIHPELAEPLAEILDETYGLIVYQEQVMADRAEGRRLQPGQRRPAAPGDGQEEEGGAGRRVRAASPTG